jgi:hypothetical protein
MVQEVKIPEIVYVGCVHPVNGEWEVLPFYTNTMNGKAAIRAGIGFRDKKTAEKYMSNCKFLASQHQQAEQNNWKLALYVDLYRPEVKSKVKKNDRNKRK